jgi:hypothetical protein
MAAKHSVAATFAVNSACFAGDFYWLWPICCHFVANGDTVIRHTLMDNMKLDLNHKQEDCVHKEASEKLRVRFKLTVLENTNHFGVTKTFRVFYIKPHSSRLNGTVERSHRTDQTEFYQLLTYTDYVDLNKACSPGKLL